MRQRQGFWVFLQYKQQLKDQATLTYNVRHSVSGRTWQPLTSMNAWSQSDAMCLSEVLSFTELQILYKRLEASLGSFNTWIKERQRVKSHMAKKLSNSSAPQRSQVFRNQTGLRRPRVANCFGEHPDCCLLLATLLPLHLWSSATASLHSAWAEFNSSF